MKALPDKWKSLRLEEICSFHRGLTYKKKDEVDFSTNAVLRANNVSLESGELDLTEIRYIDDQIKIPAAKKVRKGSLLVCMASGSKKHLGKAALVYEDYGYAFGGFMGLLLPNVLVYPKYLYWITQSKGYSDYIMGLSDGANINNLKFSQLGRYQVSLPPLPEQKRIVAILDEAFAGIATAVANAEKNLANARELFESYLHVLFGRICRERGTVKLGDVCKTGSGGTPRKSERRFYEDGNIPWLLSGEVSKKEITESSKFITEYGLKNSAAKMFPVNTVLVAMYGATAGQAGILRFASATNQAVCGVYPNDRFLAEFLYYNFLYRNKELVATASGNAQPNISQIKIKNVLVPSLPRSDQVAASEALQSLSEEIEGLMENYRRKLQSLAEFKQSLLQKAFSGELTAAKTAPDAILKEEALV